MSGGFFRGTSADQDTRFSNKQAKLLKSQKFPPELDQLVDMTKVKMDVIRPWIANRATEFVGVEDEVLINFIYGLLDGKEVDGKQIQIQLTGFMEKNTGKFMKELWSLLTSAQKNASGIPQQFLDAKAEETRKKKAETDRINYEVQKKKEQEEREAEQERKNKINADLETAKNAAAAAVTAKVSLGKASLHSNPDEEKADGRRLARAGGKNGDTRLSRDGDSPLSHRSSSSFSRSRSHSYSPPKSRSRSPPLIRRHKSRSISRSPRRRRRSTSLVRRGRSPKQSPPRRKRSPLYTRSPRRRSPSPWRRRPSPPMRRRSPPPPVRRRSPSPPLRRRSPTPPLRRQALVPRYRRRSPISSPKKHQVDSQSPRWRKSSRSRSPQYRSNWNTNREHGSRYSDMESRGYRDRAQAKRSPDREHPDREENPYDRSQHVRSGGRTFIEPQNYNRHLPIQSRSPKRDIKMSTRGPSNVPGLSPSYQSSPSPSHSTERNTKTQNQMHEERRRLSLQHGGQNERIREQRSHRKSPEIRKIQEYHNRDIENVDHRAVKVDLPKRRDMQTPHAPERKVYGPTNSNSNQESPNDMPLNLSGENRDRYESPEPRRKEYHRRSSIDHSQRRRIIQTYTSEEIEYGPGRLDHGRLSPNDIPANRSGVNRLIMEPRSHIEYDDGGDLTRDVDDGILSRVGPSRKPIQKLDSVNLVVGSDSDAEESEDHRKKRGEKRKAKRDEDEDGSMSPRPSEERREAKRRKKEEKRLRKEEKRKRREERHRRKEERRAIKAKGKAAATVTPPEKDYSGVDDSDDNCNDRDQTCKGHDEEVENEQQRLEIELRRKALESLRAKKAISR